MLYIGTNITLHLPDIGKCLNITDVMKQPLWKSF